MNKKLNVREIVFLALNVALGIVLEFVAGTFLKMPQGGTICISVLPIIFVSFRINIFYGVVCGILIGVGQGLITPPTFVAFIQYLLDYVLAFGVIGFATLPMKIKQNRSQLMFGTILVMSIKYLFHVISGIVYFAEYATGNLIWYSLVYNGTFSIPSIVIVAILVFMLYPTMKRLKI